MKRTASHHNTGTAEKMSTALTVCIGVMSAENSSFIEGGGELSAARRSLTNDTGALSKRYAVVASRVIAVAAGQRQ
jgi:hypothetical protein